MSDLLKDSIELYSKSDLKIIERMLKNAEVIVHEEDNKLSPDSREIISKMLETEREKVEKIIEKFEFEKLYKYSSIFEVSSPSDDLQEKLDSLIHNEEKITTEDVPTVIKTETLYVIKFLKRCVGVNLI